MTTLRCLVTLGLAAAAACSAPGRYTQTPPEQSIEDRINHLRSLPDAARATDTGALAMQIRALAGSPRQLELALDLASRATEGDFGRDTLQQVTTTLGTAIRNDKNPSDAAYDELAQLVRFEGMQTDLTDPRLQTATAKLAQLDEQREHADFTLTDLNGTPWRLKALHGKVVLLNFWATWCPPCRKEIPDLNALQERFKDQGLVILGVDNEEANVARPFVAEQKMRYAVLLDPGGKVSERFAVTSIPKTFIYDRNGHIAAQSIDMRTRDQFLALLGTAGLK